MVERHRLGALSDQDADLFLRKIPIAAPAIRAGIVQGACGLPFYLDLQVDLYERLMDDGVTPQPDQFGGEHPAILRRFLDHLSTTEGLTVRLASYPRALSEHTMNHLARTFMGGAGHLDWGWLTRQSFIADASDGQHLMHALMRDALQQQDQAERPDLYSAVHRSLFDAADAEAAVSAIVQVQQRTEAALARAAYHRLRFTTDAPVDDADQSTDSDATGFFAWFWLRVEVYSDAARHGFLETLLRELVGEFSGRKAQDSKEFLKLRQGLAQQIGKQGRYAEAEAEYRAVWEIQRRPEVLGEEHPQILRIRFHLAQVVDAQGRPTEADALLAGLEADMLRHLDASHRWIKELQAFQRSRRAD